MFGLNKLKAWKNRNVKLALFFTAGYAFSVSLWGNAVLSAYLKAIPPRRNTYVGLAEGLQGTMQVVVALPSGMAADRRSRQYVLFISAVVGICAVIVFLGSLMYGSHVEKKGEDGILEFVLLCISLSFFGFFDGAQSGALEAVFHDSVSMKERQQMTTAKFISRVVFRAGGPMVSALMFYVIGDTWSRKQLRFVLSTGLVICILPISLLLFFRDSKTLGMESEAIVVPPTTVQPEGYEPIAIDPVSDSNIVMQGDFEDSSVQAASANETSEQEDEEDEDEDEDDDDEDDDDEDVQTEASLENGNGAESGALLGRPLLKTRKRTKTAKYWIPRLVLTCDIVFGLASGMTNKFFALFFKSKVGLTPSQVNWLYVVSPLSVAFFSVIATRMTRTFGRIAVPVFFSSSGIMMLFGLYLMGTSHDEYLWRKTELVIPVFIARNAFMNCCSPIRKSVLIDFVPKKARARWNSLDSVTKMSWSGSAIIGGILCDKYDYGVTFLITAMMQAIAISFYASLFIFRNEIGLAK